jgi:hypothetical protein
MSVQMVTGYLDGHTPHRLIGLKVTSLSEVDILLPPMLQFAFNIQCIDAQPVNVQRHRVGFVVLRQEGSLALMIDGLSLSYIETSSLLASPATTSSLSSPLLAPGAHLLGTQWDDCSALTMTSSWQHMRLKVSLTLDSALAESALSALDDTLPHSLASIL